MINAAVLIYLRNNQLWKSFCYSHHFVLRFKFDKYNPELGGQHIRDVIAWVPPHHFINYHVIKGWIENDIFKFAGAECHNTMAGKKSFGFGMNQFGAIYSR